MRNETATQSVPPMIAHHDGRAAKSAAPTVGFTIRNVATGASTTAEARKGDHCTSVTACQVGMLTRASNDAYPYSPSVQTYSPTLNPVNAAIAVSSGSAAMGDAARTDGNG